MGIKLKKMKKKWENRIIVYSIIVLYCILLKMNTEIFNKLTENIEDIEELTDEDLVEINLMMKKMMIKN